MQIHQAVRQEEKPDESLQNSDGSPVFLLMVAFFVSFLYIVFPSDFFTR